MWQFGWIGLIFYKRIYKAILKANPRKLSLIGSSLSALGLALFLMSRLEISNNIWVSGLALVFRYHLISASIIFTCHILTIFVLFRKLTDEFADKFVYSSFLCLTVFISMFLLGLVEIPMRFTSMPNPNRASPLMIADWIIAIVITLFGLKADKCEIKSKFLRLTKEKLSLIKGYDDKHLDRIFNYSAAIYGVGLACIIVLMFIGKLSSDISNIYLCIGILTSLYVIWLLWYWYFGYKNFKKKSQ